MELLDELGNDWSSLGLSAIKHFRFIGYTRFGRVDPQRGRSEPQTRLVIAALRFPAIRFLIDRKKPACFIEIVGRTIVLGWELQYQSIIIQYALTSRC